MRRPLAWLLALSLVLLAQSGFAATRGFYLDLHGGTTSLDTLFLAEGEISFDQGAMAGVAAGYDYGYFRLEGELSYRSNDVDRIGLFGFGFEGSGKATLTAFLINLFLEYDNATPLTPYLGLGYGLGKLDFDGISAGGATVSLKNDTGNVLQLILGLAYNLPDRWRVYADYRGLLAPIAALDDPNDNRTDDDYFNNSLTLGIIHYF